MISRRNILISCAGRRVGLVRAFGECAPAHVLASDVNPAMSSACHVADRAIAVPQLGAAGYEEAIRSVIESNEIGLVIPTIDTELAFWAGIRDDLAAEGTWVSVPDPSLVTQCRDKRLTAGLFEQQGVSVPRVISDETTFPRFVKPISGSLSSDLHTFASAAEYHSELADRSKYIHQELVGPGYREYTVDMCFDAAGHLKGLVPRHRIEVRGGEISKGRTERGWLHSALTGSFSAVQGARGVLTVQFFVGESDGADRILGIEVNARFGGGYPLSHAAGADFAGAIVREAIAGETMPECDDWIDGMTMLRYDEAIYLRP